MQVLVTGAGGFIGSHLVEALLGAGYQVRALVRYNGRGDWGHLQTLAASSRANLEVVLGDVTDAFLMRRLVDGCEVVFHLAALIGIPYSYHAPASYLNTNTQGTLNVLEACRVVGVRRVIVTSTSEVYGTARYTPIDEAHPLQAQSPYAASKIAADKLAESYYLSFATPVVTLRPFNTYGPRQSARALIPTIITQALAGAHEIHLGNLTPRRDITFVTDTARAFILAATAPNIEGETIHFGNGSAWSVSEIAELCLRVVGSQAALVSDAVRQRPEKSEVDLLLCNPTKAQALLKWSPSVELMTGLQHVTDYLRQHLGAYRPAEYAI